jgi:hypothetical protein
VEEMVSLRQIAQCLGLSGNFSVIHDFLGYRTDFTGRNTSLLQQVRLLRNRRINLNIIRTGIDNFVLADEQEIDNAIQVTRAIFATVNLGIGRVEHWDISVADANGRDVPTSDADARSLTDEWTVPNASFDVYFVLNGWPGSTAGLTTIGLSAVNGPCDKNSSSAMTGCVVVLSTAAATTGQCLAHELSHYHGLSHVCILGSTGGCSGGSCQPQHQPSLMHPCIPNGGNLSSGEGQTMNNHCFVNDGCPGD